MDARTRGHLLVPTAFSVTADPRRVTNPGAMGVLHQQLYPCNCCWSSGLAAGATATCLLHWSLEQLALSCCCFPQLSPALLPI